MKAVLDFSDLFSITLHGDDIQDFDARWDQVLLSTSQVPSDGILESLCKMRVRESDHHQTVLATYEQEINQDQSKAELSEVQDHREVTESTVIFHESAACANHSWIAQSPWR